jgi:hypothetical protein
MRPWTAGQKRFSLRVSQIAQAKISPRQVAAGAFDHRTRRKHEQMKSGRILNLRHDEATYFAVEVFLQLFPLPVSSAVKNLRPTLFDYATTQNALRHVQFSGFRPEKQGVPRKKPLKMRVCHCIYTPCAYRIRLQLRCNSVPISKEEKEWHQA